MHSRLRVRKGFFRNVVAFAITAPLFLGKGGLSFALPKRGLGLLVLRSLLGTAGIFANFYAVSHIRLCDALMLNKLAPFFTVVFAALFLGERTSLRQILALVGALVGAALVIQPRAEVVSAFPALCALAGGISAGGAYACVRALGRMKTDPRVVVLFFSAFSCLASLPFLVFRFDPMSIPQLAILLAAGASAAIGQFGITAAYRFAPPREIAAWDYTNVIFAAVLGFFAFGQRPDPYSIVGFAMIVAMLFVSRRAS